MKILKKLAVAAVLSASLTVQAAPMFRIFELGVKTDQFNAFDQAAEANLIPSVTHENGTLAMHATRLKDQPDLAYLFEIYQDDTAYQAHISGDYYKGYLKKAPQLLTDHKKFIATEPQFLAEKPQALRQDENAKNRRLNVVEVWVKPEQNDAFRQIVLDEMAKSMQVEDGVLAMYAATTQADPTHWFFVEIYQDDAAYTAHRNTAHFQQYLKQTADSVTKKVSHDTGWKLLMSKGGLQYSAQAAK